MSILPAQTFFKDFRAEAQRGIAGCNYYKRRANWVLVRQVALAALSAIVVSRVSSTPFSSKIVLTGGLLFLAYSLYVIWTTQIEKRNSKCLEIIFADILNHRYLNAIQKLQSMGRQKRGELQNSFRFPDGQTRGTLYYDVYLTSHYIPHLVTMKALFDISHSTEPFSQETIGNVTKELNSYREGRVPIDQLCEYVADVNASSDRIHFLSL